MNRKFALIAEGDVFQIIRIPESNIISERYYPGLSSNPIFIECTSYDVLPGYIYDGNNFYEGSDLEKNNPLLTNNEINDLVKKYACIVDEDVFGIITFSKDMIGFDAIVAGMASNPICVECTDEVYINIGWTWDGQKFNRPL